MKTNKLFLIVALLGTVLAGCQKAELVDNQANIELTGDQIWKLKVQTVKNTGNTRALEINDHGYGPELEPYWKNGEKVAVYFGGTKLGTLLVTSADKVDPATLEGSISKPDGLDVNGSLMLLFPGRDDGAWTYVGQDGSAPSSGLLGSSFDYVTTTLTVTSINVGTHSISADVDGPFENQQSIYRFGFKVGGTGDPIEVKSFVVSSAQGLLVRTRSYSAGNWVSEHGSLTMTSPEAPTGNLYYMSIRNESTSNDTYSFSIVGSNNALYEGTQAIASEALTSYGKFLGAKSITISQKAFEPDNSETITEEVQVL